MPEVSVIMPVYGVERFVAEAVNSVLDQTFTDFELIVIDDCSPDDSIRICEQIRQQRGDLRMRIVRHRKNRGLAGARNTGIRLARGQLLAFLDSDDTWRLDKLARHVAHLRACPEVGVSFSRSEFMDEQGRALGYYQMPRLNEIAADYYLCRNPIGNGSAPVIRRQVMDEIGFSHSLHGHSERAWFDESFRRSEDIECWIRIVLQTDWLIEGLPDPLTRYRLNAGGLSAQLLAQLESWEQMIEKTRSYAPAFIARHEHLARAFQLRYLCRQAIRLRDGKAALGLLRRALGSDPRIIMREPGRTLVTAAAAALLRVLPAAAYSRMESLAQPLLGRLQVWRIAAQQRRQPARVAA